jgi:hypothetical protein
MATVAIVALNFGIMREWAYNTDGHNTNQVLIVGGLPMANALAVGLLVGRQRLRTRPFLMGFEVFGAMALVLFVVATIQFTGLWFEPYLGLGLNPIMNFFGKPMTLSLAQVGCLCSVVAVMLGLPQLAFALVGGLVFRRFRIAKSSA